MYKIPGLLSAELFLWQNNKKPGQTIIETFLANVRFSFTSRWVNNQIFVGKYWVWPVNSWVFLMQFQLQKKVCVSTAREKNRCHFSLQKIQSFLFLVQLTHHSLIEIFWPLLTNLKETVASWVCVLPVEAEAVEKSTSILIQFFKVCLKIRPLSLNLISIAIFLWPFSCKGVILFATNVQIIARKCGSST